MADEQLNRRIERLERRLERLEAHLQIPRLEPEPEPELGPEPEPATSPPVTPVRPGPPMGPVAPIGSAKSDALARIAKPVEPRATPEPEPEPEPNPDPDPVPVTPPISPPPARPTAPAVPAARAAEQEPTRSIEMLVGGRWMAWVGAAAVVLAVSFFLKIAFEKGWLEPWLRCVSGAALGLALIGAGEITLRRIGRLASAGMFGAGLAILYLVSWAAYGHYEPQLVSREASFILMALVALGGIAITFRTRFLTIGVLSILGGYATPMLLRGGGEHYLELMAFLSMLLTIALGLSAIRPEVFRPLRYVAFGAHCLVMLILLVVGGGSHWETDIIFISIWWAMLLAEATLAAVRGQSPVGNIAATLISSTLYVTAGAWLLAGFAPAGNDWLGVFTGLVALCGFAVAWHFGPGLDGLRAPPRTAMDKLAIALWAQSAVLVAVAIAMQFTGAAESFGWLAVGLASVEIARRLPSRGVGVFGLIVGGLGLTRLVLLDSQATSLAVTLVEAGGWIHLTRWGALGLVAVAMCHLAARRLGVPARDARSRFEPWKAAPIVLAAAGTLTWGILAALQCDGLAVTGAWLLAAAVLIALRRFGAGLAYLELGLVAVGCAAGRWLVVDTVAGRLDAGWAGGGTLPIINGSIAMAIAIGAVGLWGCRSLLRLAGETERDAGAPSIVGQVVLITTAVFLLIGFSFEADRAAIMWTASPGAGWSATQLRQFLLTIVWLLGGTALGLVARPMAARGGSGPPALVDGFAWCVLGLAAVKWITVDTFGLTLGTGRPSLIEHLPIVNAQMLAGLLLAGAGLLLVRVRTASERIGSEWAGWVAVSASVLVLWGLTFEVDRVLAKLEAASALSGAWSETQLRVLWWTALWAPAGPPIHAVGALRRAAPMAVTGWTMLVGAAGTWLTVATIVDRITQGVAMTTPLLNLQFSVGLGVLVLLALGSRLLLAQDRAGSLPAPLGRPHLVLGLVLAGAVGLWLGSLEIDRAFVAEPMAVQAGLSVYWSVFAVGLILVGFARRLAWARYAGLALLSMTAAKVLVVDLSQVDRIWRVLSFFVSGLLLIGTSVVYSKLAPKLLS